jgi:hypothetical protein
MPAPLCFAAETGGICVGANVHLFKVLRYWSGAAFGRPLKRPRRLTLPCVVLPL